MGFKGVFRFFAHRLFEIFVIVVLILLLPNLPPYTNFSEPFKVVPTKPLEGKLSLNEKLNDVEIWHKGDFIGPEAFEEYNGEIYVSLYGGDIVKLTGNHITPVVKTGKPCKGPHEERICGRPLGMQFDKSGALYVADAYYGVFKVNVKTGEKSLVIPVSKEIDGKKPKIPNSIALASNGDIYWSDSSSQFSLENGIFEFLADPSGRLIHYDAKTKTNRVLIDKLHFANGVALSENEEFVLVAETLRSRVHRYYLKGPKQGTRDIFVDGLPGLVDNIKSDGKGGFILPLLIAVDDDHPFALHAIGPFPLIRKLAGRVLGLTQLFFEVINKVYPCEFAEKGIHFVGHFTSFSNIFTPARVTVVRLDRSGQIVDSIHSLNKKIHHICEAFVSKDTLYLGSPFNDYIAKIPLSKVGWQDLTRAKLPEKKTTAPPPTARPSTPPPTTTTTPRPTTTTPPPTTTTTPPPTTTTPPPPPTTTPRPATKPTTSAPTTTRPASTTPPPAPKQAPPPKQQTTPPSQPAAAKQQTVPPKPTQQQTPPPKQQTPPPKQQTPPPKQQTPPPKQQTPPSKQQTPPPTQNTPPPVAQPVRDQPKSIPVQEQTKQKNV